MRIAIRVSYLIPHRGNIFYFDKAGYECGLTVSAVTRQTYQRALQIFFLEERTAAVSDKIRREIGNRQLGFYDIHIHAPPII